MFEPSPCELQIYICILINESLVLYGKYSAHVGGHGFWSPEILAVVNSNCSEVLCIKIKKGVQSSEESLPSRLCWITCKLQKY